MEGRDLNREAGHERPPPRAGSVCASSIVLREAGASNETTIGRRFGSSSDGLASERLVKFYVSDDPGATQLPGDRFAQGNEDSPTTSICRGSECKPEPGRAIGVNPI